MNRLMRTATASATFAFLAAAAAKADIVTFQPGSVLAQSGSCDASGPSCGNTVPYTAFTVSQAETITGFAYYAFLTDATYVSTNWSLWTGDSSPTEVASSGSTPIGSPMSAVPVAGIDGLELITVTLAASPVVTVVPNVQYWIGLQNNITVTADGGNSVYAGTDPTYTGGSPVKGTTTLGETGALTLPSYSKTYAYWPFENAALTIVTAPAAPEPSTWAMMLLGFVGLAWAARRRLRTV